MSTIYVVMGEAGEYEDRATWMERAFTCREAANLYIVELLARNKLYQENRDKVAEFCQAWIGDNPYPIYPTHELIKEKKFPAGLKSQDITQEMRDKRNAAREHNHVIDNNHNALMRIWYMQQKDAKRTFLLQNGVDHESIESLVNGPYLYVDHKGYSVEELEVY